MQLHAKHAHVDAVLDDDPSHVGFFFLSDTEDAAEGLLFDGVVPPEVEGDAAVGPGKIETVRTSLVICYRRGWHNGFRGETHPRPPHFKPAIKILVSSSSRNFLIALVRCSREESPVR